MKKREQHAFQFLALRMTARGERRPAARRAQDAARVNTSSGARAPFKAGTQQVSVAAAFLAFVNAAATPTTSDVNNDERTRRAHRRGESTAEAAAKDADAEAAAEVCALAST
jgi:hypothetical protein